MDKTVTYLQMNSPAELRAARPVAGLALCRLDAAAALVPEMMARVGAPHGWRSASRTASEWTAWLAHPLRQYWLIAHDGAAAGILNLEPQAGGDVEITTFGLLPEHQGQGLGGPALSLSVGQAWETSPADDHPITRVWLHTSSLDHPHALTNYLNRGFVHWRTELVPPPAPLQ